MIKALHDDLNAFSIRSEDMFRYPEDTWLEARCAAGEQIGMSLESHSADYGLLAVLAGRKNYPEASPARFLLHSEAVENVPANGGKYLLAEGKGPLFIDPGLQFFQHLTGCFPMNVLLTDEEKRAFRPFTPDVPHFSGSIWPPTCGGGLVLR